MYLKIKEKFIVEDLSEFLHDVINYPILKETYNNFKQKVLEENIVLNEIDELFIDPIYEYFEKKNVSLYSEKAFIEFLNCLPEGYQFAITQDDAREYYIVLIFQK